jgi:peptidoglycan glycosyltransferase
VNRQIRKLGVVMLVLYGLLFVQLNVVQVFRADGYNENPGNIRAVTRDYGKPRGQILSADGAVLARTVDDDSHFKRRRLYPEHELFGAVTGYFSFTYGSDGVEKTYGDELAGRSTEGSVENLVDMLVDEEHTNDVVLTLDKRVQTVARDALGNRKGSVVAIDTRTGGLIGLWSFPSYDPEPMSDTDEDAAAAARSLLLLDANKPLLPRSFRETFFPGSTFKVVTAAAGLESGKVTVDEPRYPTEQRYTPPQTTSQIGNFGNATCGGTLFDILRVSCNTSFARMGVDIGADDLVGTAQDFGFGAEPPLDLPDVARSTIESPGFFERNLPLLAQTGIGQNTMRATPLQMAMVAAGIANGGKVMTPHVLSEVRDDESKVVRRYKPSVWKTATSPQTAATIRDAMVGVVRDGTAAGMQLAGGVPTAGKTGTAQIGNGQSHAWIIGFAPADAPRVAVAVVVESQPGTNETTGGRVAAPIARQVLEAALQAASAQP